MFELHQGPLSKAVLKKTAFDRDAAGLTGTNDSGSTTRPSFERLTTEIHKREMRPPGVAALGLFRAGRRGVIWYENLRNDGFKSTERIPRRVPIGLVEIA